MISSKVLRQKYLDFFKSKAHIVIPSASLLPENDPTVLFNTAGMQPLVPYLLGTKHPVGLRLVSAQKCVRTNDIDEVGDATHLTFFEMLGNWSLGNPANGAGYFKSESIAWSYEFLTNNQWLGLDKNRLAFTVFEGDDNCPFDQESYDLWLAQGIKSQRLAKLGKADNWWGPAAATGPCGPDTEIFYWTGAEDAPEDFDTQDKRWVEIWNNVFMAFNKITDNQYKPLEQKNVDTGMGLERTLCILNNTANVYETDLFSEAIKKLEEISNKQYQDNLKAFRVIVDHIRAATMIIGDEHGVGPSNTDQGYVVRKLIRRALRFGKQLGIADDLIWLKDISNIFIACMAEIYPEVKINQSKIISELDIEEIKFKNTLANGLKIFNKINHDLSGVEAFDLFQTYGFPIELTLEMAKEKNLQVDLAGFKTESLKHQELSRTATAGKFKGGLADDSEATTKLHTAAHLTLAALRQVLGEHVFQKGSNITAERLRFDFSHPDKLTPEQIAEVERLVNEQIALAQPVSMQEMALSEAKAIGAMGVFESKYNDRVKVYTIGQGDKVFSKEICGGPHVMHTGSMGKYKITKEESSSAGVRRIKAVLE